VDNTRDYARVSHSRQWSNYNIVSSLPSGTKLYALPYDYRKLITKCNLGNLNIITSLFSTYRKLLSYPKIIVRCFCN